MIHPPELRPASTQPAPGRPRRHDRIRRTIRLLACCLLLAGLPFVTAPGNVIADTKLDLAIDPARFLSRALTLWDPQQFGQLQDQAAGYLFPMGPFFALGRLAALDPWVIQRLWIGAILVTAFLGTARLADRLGIGTPWTRVIAGFAYALSPAALTLAGELSSELLPAALLPWILIPLVGVANGGAANGRVANGGAANGRVANGRVANGRVARRGGRPRAAAQSAAAVALCGGINAAATIAVLVPAVLYVLTLARPAPRWRILAWWFPAVLLATLWWSVPLLLLSKYGVSIVPYTESAAVTTSVTSLSAALRGTEDWVGYLVVNGQPWWQLGYRIATGVLPTLLTGLIAGLGLAGLIRRGLPGRRFLLCAVLAGVVIISAGHVSSLGNPLAGPVDHLINSPASAFRNVRKFDPMIRLPIVLGLAHLLASARVPQRPRLLRLRAPLAALAALAIGGLALPGYLSGLAGAGSFSQIPSYWVNAANWLNARAGHQAVLVVPGAAFGQYLWGSPLDDVLQPLATVDWAERNLSTIGSPGNERLLDAIDQRLAAGDGSAGLTQVLARMGVKYVLVRNDLDRSALDGAWPARVNQALSTSPGIARVAQFGFLDGSFSPNDAVSNFDTPYPPVEIYRVSGAAPVATVQPAAGTLRVYGGPEAMLALADENLLGSRPVLLNSDSPGLPAAASVVTDSLRRRVRNFGELRSSYSPTLTATDPAQTFEATGDYTEPGWASYLSVAQYHGIANVTASSSDSDIGAIPAQWASGLLPYSAIDGDMGTMWESGSWTGPIGQWIQLDFRSLVNPGVIGVAFADNTALGPAVTRVTVQTAAGELTDRVRVTGSPQPLRVPRGVSGWLRITVTGLAEQPSPAVGPQVGISEISVPGVQASRTITAPDVSAPDPTPELAPAGSAREPGLPGSARLKTVPLEPAPLEPAPLEPAQGAGDPAAVVLAKAQPQPSGCMLTSLRWVCSPSLAVPTEEQYGFDQAFTEPAAGRARLRGSAVLVAPSLVEKYARFGQGSARVVASSTYTDDPEDLARSAFDGDPATTWVASPADAHPMLAIRWRGRRKVSRVTIQRPPGAAGLLQVLVAGSRGQVRGGLVDSAGTLRFAPMRTTSLTFTFTPLQGPLQISDVRIPGVRPLGTPSARFRLACGLGPLIRLNGTIVATRVGGTFADLLTGRPLRFAACSQVTTAAGTNHVVEPAGDAFDVQDVALVSLSAPGATGPGATGPGATGPGATGPGAVSPGSSARAATARVESWTADRRVLQVTADTRSYLVVNENFNAGWRASLGGRRLRAIRLDGWKQAWLLPAGTAGVVTLTYLPNAPYRAAIIGGLGALLLVMLVALVAGVVGLRGGRSRRPRSQRYVLRPTSSAAVTSGTAASAAVTSGAVTSRTVGSGEMASRAVASGAVTSRASLGAAASGAVGSGEVASGGNSGAVTSRAVTTSAVAPAASSGGVTSAMVACGVLLTGFWLGGYPGAAILAVSTALFMVAASYRRSRRYWLELSRPRVLTGLLLAASACGAAGEHLLLGGGSGLLVTGLWNAIPQVICLIVVGRLAAALILPDP